MLQTIAPNIWHTQHEFVANGMRVSSRMTVVRLSDSSLWVHSPVPLSADIRAQLSALGDVQYIVAPNKTHHLFISEYIAAFPQAKIFGAPGLLAKRPDLNALRELTSSVEPEWQEDLGQIFFEGIPFGNETVWFHRSSRTLIITDLCQWWQGDLPLTATIYANLTGVRTRLAVPRTVRWLVKDHHAAQSSARRILQWPFERVVLAHNSIIDVDAHAAVKMAFACFEQ
ncbi:DUF4336 domain-containing protein [Undibacterium sp.]|uniref:DUF4336 domain-containing protein n=1 Tax=Undibacterium sp. TaxID=1914977 RepID=UPI002D02B73D|nr:DUF4336 domain-containing protein [Undibacterium sp.]HTD05843.1 DUF4336 domain-containing protein [Undibacterium sp.]